uniref:Uncharacterized protein n=1 Tax=Mola mola TaxID=94237 RepID=A0A3Q3XI95_MOLML
SRRERLRRRQNLDWMSRLPEELLAVPLWNLALPGSHDSMSFCLDVTSPVVRSEPRLLRLIDRLSFPLLEEVLARVDLGPLFGDCCSDCWSEP